MEERKNNPAVNKTEENLLEVKNLKVYFNTESGLVKAVDGVNFHIKRGETIGIVGESGSGKSVTALSVMGLISTTSRDYESGEILFKTKDGTKKDLTKLDDISMQHIRGNDVGMIFQEPMTSLNPVYTCGDQVAESIIVHNKVSYAEAKKRTLDIFEKVSLPNPERIFKSYPHEISGGQKQRVMISMAIACNPSLVIADEPTTALDVTVQATILDLLTRLKLENDSAIMFITHDLGVIAELADRVVVMYQGKVVEQGTVKEIFENPQHPYTKGLLACRPKLGVRMKVLPTVSDFMVVSESGKLEERDNSAYKSIGEAIVMNYVSHEDFKQRQVELMTKEPHLRVKNLSKHFPTKTSLFGKAENWVKAVDDVTFDVYPGETIGLVGESGCGKTTLGRTILKLTEPTAGSIEFEGVDISKLKTEEMRRYRKDIQIIFQDPYSSLNPRMSIGEAIMEPMRVHQIFQSEFARRRHAIELLELVSLRPEHFNRYPFEFSGGQRQRISIARALALQPKFIILDESVSALDVSVQAQVLNLLNKLKKEFNFTYIFISHDLSVVKFMSDRMIVMNKGKIEEMGYSEDIYENPKSEYTRTLINSIPKGDMESIIKAQVRRELLKVELGKAL